MNLMIWIYVGINDFRGYKQFNQLTLGCIRLVFVVFLLNRSTTFLMVK